MNMILFRQRHSNGQPLWPLIWIWFIPPCPQDDAWSKLMKLIFCTWPTVTAYLSLCLLILSKSFICNDTFKILKGENTWWYQLMITIIEMKLILFGISYILWSCKLICFMFVCVMCWMKIIDNSKIKTQHRQLTTWTGSRSNGRFNSMQPQPKQQHYKFSDENNWYQ